METSTKAKEFFSLQNVLGFTIVSGNREGWRCRVKLAVRQAGRKVQIGLFRKGTHEILPILDCRDHHPRINEAIELISSFLEEHIRGYDEKTHTGEVRYIQCVVERATSRIQASFVVNTPFGKVWVERLNRLYAKNPLLWHSLWINVQQTPTNTIFGKEWHHVMGEKYVWEFIPTQAEELGGYICGLQVPFLPSHFGQANLEMFEKLLEDLLACFPSDAHIAELFSGMGLISIILRPKARSITLYEIEPSAKESFLLLQKQLPPHLQENCTFIVGDANTAHEVCERATAVILDPPRKGVSEGILRTILRQKNIQHVLYISCCWDTFERDAEILLHGGFSIQNAKGYIFFPGTDHLETMCLFSRSE